MPLRGFSLTIALLAAAAANAATAEQRLARGEVVVTRLPSAQSGLLGGQAQGVVDAPLERVWAVLNRSEEFADYMPNYLVSWLIERSALTAIGDRTDWHRPELEDTLAGYRMREWHDDTVLFYNVLDMPFPFSDRWYLLNMWRDTTARSIHWHQLLGNLKSNEGSWQVERWPDARHTLATYTTVSAPGIALPGFILAIGLNSALPGVIKGLRNRVAETGQQ